MANTSKMSSGKLTLASEGGWKEYRGNAYRCPVYVLQEADGGFSATAATMLGIAAKGVTEREALDHLTTLLAETISRIKQAGEVIPWLTTAQESRPGAKTKWLIVHL